MGFSTNSTIRPSASVSITPYFPATSTGARTIAAIVTTGRFSRWVRYIGPSSKSMIESVGNTSAGPVRSQCSSIRSVESALPRDAASNFTGEYWTSTPRLSP